MSERTPPFDEALLSGLLDGELTQADAQRVRLHLERNEEARRLFEDLKRMREAARGTAFRVPGDQQWDETPRSWLAALARRIGFGILLAWFASVVGVGLWLLATTPEHVWLKLATFGALSGFGLLFVSVVLDRLKDLPGDRYRKVQK
jgi:anti-sigma factor RsiW